MPRLCSRITARRQPRRSGSSSPIAQPDLSGASSPTARMLLRPQQRRRPIERVALADAAEVDFESLPLERDGLTLGIEQQVLHADALAHGRTLGFRRHAALAAIETPRLDQGADGNIESARRL